MRFTPLPDEGDVRIHAKSLIRMSLRIRLVALVCIGIGIAPQFLLAESSYHSRAKFFASQNDIEKASAYFSRALNAAPSKQSAGVASDYAAFLMETGNLNKAELILKQALTQSPHNEELIRMLAQCLVRQEKVVEGRRYLKSICSDREAQQEIAAICQDQGNTDMAAAVEKKWGTAKPEPVLVAVLPNPTLSAKGTMLPPNRVIANAPVASLPPAPVAVAAKSFVAAATAIPVVPPSKSEIFDTKVPIPVPRPTAPLPAVASFPKPAPVPMLPAPQPMAIANLPKPAPLPAAAISTSAKRTLVLEHPVRLPIAPQPVMSETTPFRPASAPQPRRHYIVNANASSDLDALFPIKPAVATVPAR